MFALCSGTLECSRSTTSHFAKPAWETGGGDPPSRGERERESEALGLAPGDNERLAAAPVPVAVRRERRACIESSYSFFTRSFYVNSFCTTFAETASRCPVGVGDPAELDPAPLPVPRGQVRELVELRLCDCNGDSVLVLDSSKLRRSRPSA